MSIFKNVNRYVCDNIPTVDNLLSTIANDVLDEQEIVDSLHEFFSEFMIEAPGNFAWSSMGFTPVDGYATVVHCAGMYLCAIKTIERVLPSSVINTEVSQQAKELQSRLSRDISRKEIAEIKNDVVCKFLPEAHLAEKVTPVVFCLQDGNINVDIYTSSVKMCDNIICYLRKINETFPVEPLFSLPQATNAFLSDICLNNVGYVVRGDRVSISNYSDGKCTLAYNKLRPEGWFDVQKNIDQYTEINKVEVRVDGAAMSISKNGTITGIRLVENVPDDDIGADLFLTEKALDIVFKKYGEHLAKQSACTHEDGLKPEGRFDILRNITVLNAEINNVASRADGATIAHDDDDDDDEL